MRILVTFFCGHAFPFDLAREFARRGHSVQYIYFADNSTSPDADPASWPGATKNFQIEGLHLPIKFSKHSLRTRRKADVAFGKAVAAKILAFRPDVVLSGNTPLDSQKVMQRAAKRAKAKFIFWQQDVYYLAVRYVIKKKLRMLSNLAGAYYERLEKKLLKKSDGVICIAPEFTKLVTDWGVEPSRVFTIENWAALDDVSPMDKDNEWSRAHGVDRKFCFMYSGTLGMKHRPELLLALARYLETINNACLIVVAGGTGADWLRENAQTVRKDVLTLLPFQPYKRISEVLGASDVLIALLDSSSVHLPCPPRSLCYLCCRPIADSGRSARKPCGLGRRAVGGRHGKFVGSTGGTSERGQKTDRKCRTERPVCE